MAFADYDGDGFTDIFVANDGMQQYLFHNNGNGTFTEVGLEAGAALISRTGGDCPAWAWCFKITTMTAGPTLS